MPTKLVPINGSVLAWALQEASRDVEGLAEELKVAPATVEAWVSGESKPSTTNFQKIAKALRVKLYRAVLSTDRTTPRGLSESDTCDGDAISGW